MGIEDYLINAYNHKISAKDLKIEGEKFVLNELNPNSNKKSIASCKKFAYFFEKEMKRERRPSSNVYDPKSRCYLINVKNPTSNSYISIGAIILKHSPNHWEVGWVWIHPFERKEGAFKFAINELEKIHGELFIKDIISPVLATFAQKYKKKHTILYPL